MKLNKKAKWGFLHFLFLSVLIITTYIFYLNMTEKSTLNELRRSIGENEILLTDLYQNYENDILNYEIILKYSSDKASKKFYSTNGITETCKGVWKLNSGCDPDFESYYITLLKENLEIYNIQPLDIKINGDLISVDFGNKEYKSKTKIAEAVYKNNGIITIKKDFSSLNSVKDRLRECILKNMLESCFTNKKQENNNITFAFSNINETIFLDNKVETLSFNFKIDKDDTGLNTSF